MFWAVPKSRSFAEAEEVHSCLARGQKQDPNAHTLTRAVTLQV